MKNILWFDYYCSVKFFNVTKINNTLFQANMHLYINKYFNETNKINNKTKNKMLETQVLESLEKFVHVKKVHVSST